MSTVGARPGLSMDASGLWNQRAMQRSRALVRTYLQSNSVPSLTQPNGTRQRDTVRLPSLAAVKAPQRQTTMTQLSISKPSLFTPGERALFEGFSRNRRHPLRKRPLPLCMSCDTVVGGNNLSQSSRPVYTHFSYPIRPNPKLVKPRSQSLTLATKQGELRPLMQYRQSSQGEGLTVRGKPCLSFPSQPLPPTAPMPARTQLHIFLPTEGFGEGDEGDSESVDEGFMDELDSKITSLKLQQGKAKIHIHPD